MGQGRRQFTDEFKREAVALLASSGRPLTQIAGELGSRLRCFALARSEWRVECGAGAAPQHDGVGPAFRPGPGGRDLPTSPRERSAADGARHSKKTVAIYSISSYLGSKFVPIRSISICTEGLPNPMSDVAQKLSTELM